MRPALFALLGTFLISPAGATPLVLHVAPDSSHVQFFITHPVGNVRNTPGTPSGEVRVEHDVAGAGRLSGKVTVDLRGLETGIDRRTRHIKSEEFLDVERFPLAEFEFAEVVQDSPLVAAVGAGVEVSRADSAGVAVERIAGEDSGTSVPEPLAAAGESPIAPVVPSSRTAPIRWKGRARGRFTVHGVSRDLEVPVELAWAGERLRVRGQFRMLLADHGIKRPKKLLFEAGKYVDVTLDLLFVP